MYTNYISSDKSPPPSRPYRIYPECRAYEIRNALSDEGILDCPGARTSECTRGPIGNSVVYHHINSPGALNVKAVVKTREHDSRREHCISREPPGYYFGERVSLTECSSRWPWSDVFSTDLDSPPRGCINKGMLYFLSGEKTMCCTKLLLEQAVYCQEQDEETIRRAAHRSRAQAWRSS